MRSPAARHALEQVTRAERRPIARVRGRSRTRTTRRGDIVELGEARELVQHRLGDARGRARGIPRRAQVLEWQHGNRQAPRPAWTEVRLPHEQHGDGRQQHGDDRDISVPTQAVGDRTGNALGRSVTRET
jgi:hypothetical protein